MVFAAFKWYQKNQDQKCDSWQISKVSQLNIKFSTLKSDLVDRYCEINIWHWQKIGFELINGIPESILKTDSTRNIFGCPDCDDGCGLYFEFQLDEPNSKPIIYEMEYGLNGTTEEIKKFIVGSAVVENKSKYNYIDLLDKLTII